MDLNIFIDSVVKEVMKKLEIELPKTLFIGKEGELKDELDKASIKYVWYECCEDNIDIMNFDYILIDGISNFELVSSALLVPGTNISKLLFKARLINKDIYIEKDNIEYKKYLNTIDKGLEKQLMYYEDCIISYGVKILTAAEILMELKGYKTHEIDVNKLNSKDVNKTADVYRFDKKVITEQDLKKLIHHGNRNFRVGKGSIITPLAIDYMKTNEMSLFKD